MANQLGSPLVTPRSRSQHERHARFARVRNRPQFSAFLATQATRLSTTAATIFGKLKTNTAARIKSASTEGSLS